MAWKGGLPATLCWWKTMASNDHPMDSWLDRYPPGDDAFEKDSASEPPAHAKSGPVGRKPASSTRGLRRMAHQAELDLHGYSVSEAKRRTDAFLKECRRAGYRKVLVIHGKGNHADSEGKLKREIRMYLQRHPIAGRLLEPDRRNGGHGAVWIVLR